MKKEQMDKWLSRCIALLSGMYGLLCGYLYYKQTFHVEGLPYESDLPYHISMAVDDHWFYSLTAILYQLFYLTPFGSVLTAVFLGSINVITIYATYLLFQKLVDRYEETTSIPYYKSVLLGGALVVNLAMPFFVKAAHYQRYIGYQSATIWHNSTYLCMKLCGVLALLLYFEIEQQYDKRISIKQWITFALILIIANGVKPSFVMVFAPTMALFLLLDLITKKAKFKNIFLFGLTVIPSLAVILWQNVVLFGSDTGNGIELNYGYTLTLHSTNPKVTLLLSIAFPLFVLLICFMDLLKDRLYLFAWLLWGIGLVEVTFLNESGKRARDGNFLWGYSFCIFFLFIISVVKCLTQRKNPTGILKNVLIRRVFYLLAICIMGYQVYCGIYFFSQLLNGTTYWM